MLISLYLLGDLRTELCMRTSEPMSKLPPSEPVLNLYTGHDSADVAACPAVLNPAWCKTAAGLRGVEMQHE